MVQKEITRLIRKYLETNVNENTAYQNLRDAVEALFRGKYIAINVRIKKKETSSINTLLYTLKD